MAFSDKVIAAAIAFFLVAASVDVGGDHDKG
jgi:hypothetical protein